MVTWVSHPRTPNPFVEEEEGLRALCLNLENIPSWNVFRCYDKYRGISSQVLSLVDMCFKHSMKCCDNVLAGLKEPFSLLHALLTWLKKSPAVDCPFSLPQILYASLASSHNYGNMMPKVHLKNVQMTIVCKKLQVIHEDRNWYCNLCKRCFFFLLNFKLTLKKSDQIRSDCFYIMSLWKNAHALLLLQVELQSSVSVTILLPLPLLASISITSIPLLNLEWWPAGPDQEYKRLSNVFNNHKE